MAGAGGRTPNPIAVDVSYEPEISHYINMIIALSASANKMIKKRETTILSIVQTSLKQT